MSNDELEDVAMDDADMSPAFSFKGKGKVVEEDYSQNESLPWCGTISSHAVQRLTSL